MCIYVCMHVCIYASMHLSIYLSIYLCIYVSTYLRIYVSMHLCIYVSMYLCIYVSMYHYVSMYLCVYVSMYLCMYLHAQGSHCHFLAFDYHINVSCQYLWTVYTLSTYIHITSCHGGNMLMERWLHLFPLECFAPERWEVILTSYSLKCDACLGVAWNSGWKLATAAIAIFKELTLLARAITVIRTRRYVPVTCEIYTFPFISVTIGLQHVNHFTRESIGGVWRGKGLWFCHGIMFGGEQYNTAMTKSMDSPRGIRSSSCQGNSASRWCSKAFPSQFSLLKQSLFQTLSFCEYLWILLEGCIL